MLLPLKPSLLKTGSNNHAIRLRKPTCSKISNAKNKSSTCGKKLNMLPSPPIIATSKKSKINFGACKIFNNFIKPSPQNSTKRLTPLLKKSPIFPKVTAKISNITAKNSGIAVNLFNNILSSLFEPYSLFFVEYSLFFIICDIKFCLISFILSKPKLRLYFLFKSEFLFKFCLAKMIPYLLKLSLLNINLLA